MNRQIRRVLVLVLVLFGGLPAVVHAGGAAGDRAVALVSSVSGEVKLQRPGAGELLPVALGDQVFTADVLYTFANARASLLMADGSIFTLHPDSRMALAALSGGDGKQGTVISTLSSSVAGGLKDLFAPRNKRESLTAVAGFRKATSPARTDGAPLRILYPRNSIITAQRPRFSWHSGAGGETTVSLTLKGIGGNLWRAKSAGDTLVYPEDRPPLVPGQAYFLRVAAAGNPDAVEEVYFSVIEPAAATEVADLERQMDTLRSENPGDVTPDVVLAGYYRSMGLHHRALTTLQKIADHGDAAVLGFVRREQHLNHEAMGLPY
jgi:hypothetical protein